uniref:Uncharacterized protein n=1 Tax=Oryza barthii TaxID=65489 RepID=A0A0D3GKI6_9ORYZ
MESSKPPPSAFVDNHMGVAYIRLGSMEAALLPSSTLLPKLVELSWYLLLKEDIRVIRSGGGHKITLAKQDLQELQNCINKASFFLAGTGRINAQSWQTSRLHTWISDALKAASCLEDQIAMYAMRGVYVGHLYAMKSAIGMLSTDKLVKIIRDRKNEMPTEVQNYHQEVMERLPAILPFTPHSHCEEQDTVPIGFMEKIEELKNILLRDAAPVIFVSGEQLSGKTTLMNQVYKDIDVRNHFKIRSKVDMSKTRCLSDLLRAVLKHEERETNSMYPDAIDELKIIEEIQRTFRTVGNRYLMVMDDVDDTSSLHVLRHVLGGWEGKIVCLTRNTRIQYEELHAKVEIRPLELAYQQQLLVHVAFRNADDTPAPVAVDRNNDGQQEGGGEYDQLEKALKGKTETDNINGDDLTPMVETLKGILRKCRGNPWNIRAVGALLGANRVDKWKEIEENQVDDLVIGDKKRDPLIPAEYAQLPADIRLGFLYCLAFPERSEIPENSLIPARKLVRLWTAEGFPPNDSPLQSQEQEAENLLQRLIDYKLLVVKKTGLDGEVLKCKVNEHMRSLALEMCEAQKICRFARDPAHPAPRTRPSSSLFSRKTALLHRYRVLAVHGDGDGNEAVQEMSSAMSKDIRLRSLLYFRTERKEPPKLELSFGRTYKLLRTLDLQGTRLTRLHSSITCLVCLRYLGLRGTQLEYLPETLQSLRRLMCLDIRDTGITEVNDVSEFKEMRHLYLANSFRDQSVLIKEGLLSLLHLQTLSGATHEVPSERKKAGMVPFEQELLYLKLLRKLSVKKASISCSKGISDAINKMDLLQSLTITCAAGEKRGFNLSYLNVNKDLRKLKLGGRMQKFDRLQPKLQSITYLYLWDSKLPVEGKDPLQLLQGLQQLLLLSLYNVYEGEKLTCTNGYHKLKKLSIIAMGKLNECTFGTKNMANLEVLVFAKCARLSSPPPKLDELNFLREVHLAQMPQGFYDGMKPATKKLVHFPEFQHHFHSSTRAVVQGGS